MMEHSIYGCSRQVIHFGTELIEHVVDDEVFDLKNEKINEKFAIKNDIYVLQWGCVEMGGKQFVQLVAFVIFAGIVIWSDVLNSAQIILKKRKI